MGYAFKIVASQFYIRLTNFGMSVKRRRFGNSELFLIGEEGRMQCFGIGKSVTLQCFTFLNMNLS